MDYTAGEEQEENSFQAAENAATADYCGKGKSRVEEQDSRRLQVDVQGCTFDMESDGAFGTGVDAFAALGAGEACFSCLQAWFIDAESGAAFQAKSAIHAFGAIDSYFKYIQFVEERLKSAEGAEQSALDTASGKYRQGDDQADEQRNKDEGLQRCFHGLNRRKFGDGLEGAQPGAVGGRQSSGGSQYDSQ